MLYLCIVASLIIIRFLFLLANQILFIMYNTFAIKKGGIAVESNLLLLFQYFKMVFELMKVVEFLLC